MLPKAIGVCSDWGFHGGTLYDQGGCMEQDRVWLGPTSVGVVGGSYEVGWSHAGHMILCPQGLGMAVRPLFWLSPGM